MKSVKMVLYGEPGVGKSVFASKAPNPFFICTDGNYEWLEEFGADPEAHVNVNSWSEAKQVFEKLNTEEYDKYQTIVLDLTEDFFKWCEQEYCIRNKIDHLSDLAYGKAYDATRNEFFIEICKLFSMNKHVILLMHGVTTVVKDRRGVEHTKYTPSSRIPDKVLDMIEGRTRYFLRCYLKDEELEDGTLLKKRYLSLIPKPDEFGIVRGIDENSVPHDIPLEWSEFAKYIGLNNPLTESAKNTPSREKKIDKENVPVKAKHKAEAKIEVSETIVETPATTEQKEEPVKEEKKEPVAETKQLSNEERIAAIKAKLAALNNKK